MLFSSKATIHLCGFTFKTFRKVVWALCSVFLISLRIKNIVPGHKWSDFNSFHASLSLQPETSVCLIWPVNFTAGRPADIRYQSVWPYSPLAIWWNTQSDTALIEDSHWSLQEADMCVMCLWWHPGFAERQLSSSATCSLCFSRMCSNKLTCAMRMDFLVSSRLVIITISPPEAQRH